MKKSKTPIVLLALAFVIFAIVAAVNSGADLKKIFASKPQDAAQTPPAREMSTQERQGAKQALADSMGGDPQQPQADLDQGRPVSSSVVMPEQVRLSPEPNDSMTSSHWYRDEYMDSEKLDDSESGE